MADNNFCACNGGDAEYIIELNQQGPPGVQGPRGEQGYSPVVTYTVNNDTIQFTLVNENSTQTTPNFYDYLAKKDLSNTTYSADLANKLDKDGTNADSPITLNKLIITRGTTTTADVYLSTTNDRNISINAPIRTINNIQLSPYGTTGIVTYKGNELATLNDLPDISTKLNRDGSNATGNFKINNVSILDRAIATNGRLEFWGGSDVGLVFTSDGVTLYNYTYGDVNISSPNGFLKYNDNIVATVNQIPTVGNGTITITQGGVTKGTFTTNQSGNTTINLDAGGGSSTNPIVLTETIDNKDYTIRVGVDDSTGSAILSYQYVNDTNVTITRNLASQTYAKSNGGLKNNYTTEYGVLLNTLEVGVDNDTIQIDNNGNLVANIPDMSGYYTKAQVDAITSVLEARITALETLINGGNA